MHLVKFIATDEQLMELIRLATGEDSPVRTFIYPRDERDAAICLDEWRGRDFFMLIYHDEHEGRPCYSLFHGNFVPLQRRPWNLRYPSALALVSAVEGIEVLLSETAQEHYAKDKQCSLTQPRR